MFRSNFIYVYEQNWIGLSVLESRLSERLNYWNKNWKLPSRL